MADDTSGDEPLDGDVQPPGKKGGRKPGPATGKGFGRQQTPEERSEEEAGSRAFYALVAAGGFDWRHKDWEPTKQQRDAVKMLKFCGYTDEDISYATGMSVESLQKYFEFELKTAKMLLIGDLANRAMHRAKQGNDVLTMFLLKTRGDGRFSEKAAMVGALVDESAAGGVDESKRAQVVSQILDLLDARKNKPKKATKEGSDDDSA